jgi:hypothetical protein
MSNRNAQIRINSLDALATEVIRQILVAKQENNVGQWIVDRNTSPEECADLARRMREDPSREAGGILHDWTNKLTSSAVSEVLAMLVRVGKANEMETLLLVKGAEISGSLHVLTAGELEFLKFAIDTFPDMSEVFVVDELGYNAIFLVFANDGWDAQSRKIGICQRFLWDHDLKIEYFVLHPDNIQRDDIEPRLHVTFEEG